MRRLSEGGGTAPVWSPDGSALYYLDAGGMLTRVHIRLEPSVSFEGPQALFQFRGNFRVSGNTSAYDVTQDGRLIVVSQTETFPAPRQFNIVLNWFEELKRVASPN